MSRAARLAVAFCLMIVPHTPVFADDGRIGGEPGNVHVIASDDIRLEAETVQAVVYDRFAEYVVDFRFVNSGATQDVRLGFPFGLDDKTGDDPPNALAGFQAFQGALPLSVKPVEGQDGPLRVGWFEHTATFPTGETAIRVRYLTRPSVTAGVDEAVLARAPKPFRELYGFTCWYPYVLHTGSGWAGTIDRAVVRYTFSADFFGWGIGGDADSPGSSLKTSPAGFSRPTPDSIQWILEDFEPLQERTGGSPFDINATYVEPVYSPGSTGESDPGAPPYRAFPPIVDATASSESAERDYPSELKFGARMAADGDPSTSWLSAPRDADSAHWEDMPEYLRVIARIGHPVRELRIASGYLLTPQTYLEHGRPKRLLVEFSDGISFTVDVADVPLVQRFAVEADAAWAKLTVLDVYPGSVYDDVAIAEIELGSRPAPEFASFEQVLAASGSAVDHEALTVTDPWVVGTEPEPVPTEEPTPGEGPGNPATESPREPAAQWPFALGAVLIAVAAGIIVFRRPAPPQA